jgi:hypothetical protein
MIVLDEHLLGVDFQAAIARWYRGAVIDITQLRPGAPYIFPRLKRFAHVWRFSPS